LLISEIADLEFETKSNRGPDFAGLSADGNRLGRQTSNPVGQPRKNVVHTGVPSNPMSMNGRAFQMAPEWNDSTSGLTPCSRV
jgi:hypothetical protein